MFSKALQSGWKSGEIRLQKIVFQLFWVFMVKQNLSWLGILLKMGLQNKKWNIKNVSSGHQFEDDAIAQFESISKCRTERCGFFHFENDMRYGDTLGDFTWRENSGWGNFISSSIFGHSSTVFWAMSVGNALHWCWILYTAIIPPRNKNINFFYC